LCIHGCFADILRWYQTRTSSVWIGWGRDPNIALDFRGICGESEK
jgi:hypothetical protein